MTTIYKRYKSTSDKYYYIPNNINITDNEISNYAKYELELFERKGFTPQRLKLATYHKYFVYQTKLDQTVVYFGFVGYPKDMEMVCNDTRLQYMQLMSDISMMFTENQPKNSTSFTRYICDNEKKVYYVLSDKILDQKDYEQIRLNATYEMKTISKTSKDSIQSARFVRMNEIINGYTVDGKPSQMKNTPTADPRLAYLSVTDRVANFTSTAPAQTGGSANLKRTSEKAQIGSVTRCVYKGPRGAKYVKMNGKFVSLKSALKIKSKSRKASS